MKKMLIQHVIECPEELNKQKGITWCYVCSHFMGLEYIDDGFKYVVCDYDQN